MQALRRTKRLRGVPSTKVKKHRTINQGFNAQKLVPWRSTSQEWTAASKELWKRTTTYPSRRELFSENLITKTTIKLAQKLVETTYWEEHSLDKAHACLPAEQPVKLRVSFCASRGRSQFECLRDRWIWYRLQDEYADWDSSINPRAQTAEQQHRNCPHRLPP